MTDPQTTILVVIRGNSGSGKSSIARAVRLAYGRGCALVEQDHLRRIILRELDGPGGLAPDFIDHTVRYLLDNGYHVVLEGILAEHKYGAMVRALLASHRGTSSAFYLDIPFEETVRRHATRPQSADFTTDQMRGWYRERDVLGVDGEHVIGPESSFDDSVALIAARSGLAAAAPVAGGEPAVSAPPPQRR
ncbi:kinase [Catellatospora sichuanensis]|uniref:kinase n=1 Tax=Catellatospora sichuanensis TaxID=1969805 RepID=UPI0011827837|nr:kinase [Catellatospora sichuanensis]